MTMYNQYKIMDEIGSGSYGKIYKVKDADDKLWALKQIRVNNEGIPCLLESSIMVAIRHPALNKAEEIFCDSRYLNIIQELAISDLSKHVKKKITPLDQVRRWLYRITSALYSLHRLGFIHGDIKGVNVLYFGDDDVRLGDFTLSTRIWHKDDMFCQHAGTYSHCAPELLLGKIWNRSLDIWALGCLFYEIAFGKLLFNYQERLDDHKEMRLRYHNAIISWLNRKDYVTNDKYPLTFIPSDKESLLDQPEYQDFRDLLHRMLKYDQHSRINVRDILNHRFFSGFTTIPCKIVDTPKHEFTSIKMERVSSKINKMMSPSIKTISRLDINHINTFAMQIYIRSYGLISDKTDLEDILICGSIWISFKLVIGVPPIALSTIITNDRIKTMENSICNYLRYCLPVNLDIIDF